MSLLFADIFEAIRCLRLGKGTTEKDIMNYVQERVGGCLSVGNVLKTIRCLHKLVEEGVLVKKGRRYLFPSNRTDCDQNQDDCDDEEDDDDCEEEEEECEDEDDYDDECEDEDDDDDDDDEEEDDDDDDSDECEEKDVAMGEMQISQKDPNIEETGVSKAISKNKSPLSKNNENCNNNFNSSGKPNASSNKEIDSLPSKSNGKKTANKNGRKGKPVIEQKNNGKNKGGETFAFCARDFIDSQYRPKSDVNTQEKPVKPEKKPEDITQADEKAEQVNKFGTKRRESKIRKSRINNDCRSRSPIKGVKAGLYHDLKVDKSEEMGSDGMSSQIFQEPTDADMDMDFDKDVKNPIDEFDVYRHRSPAEPHPPVSVNLPDKTKDSYCSDIEKKFQDEIKIEHDAEADYTLKKTIDTRPSYMRPKENQCKRLAKDSGDKAKEKHRRDSSHDDDNLLKDENHQSLCSVCEKQKRDS